MPTFRNLTSYADGTPGSTDRLLFETDGASGSQPRGVALANLPAITIDQNEVVARTAAGSGPASGFGSAEVTEDTTPASGDYLLGWNNAGALRRFDVANLPSGGGGITVDQHEIVARTDGGAGPASGFGPTEVTEEGSPAIGDFLLGWESGGALRRFNVGNLPTSTGSFNANTAFGASRPSEVNRSLNAHIQDLINVKDFGLLGDGATNDRTALNSLITACNGLANPQRTILYFPPGDYMVNGGPLNTASGAYSIVMDAGACIFYTSTSGTHNQPMWRIGGATGGVIDNAQSDGEGIRRFQLAAEVTGVGGANYGTPPTSGNVNNVAFEIVNIKHCRIYVMRATEFHTGLRLTADGENPASPGTIIGDRHVFDVAVELGYFHSCVHNVVQRTRYNAWMNNIVYHNGHFTPAPNFQCRYISLLCEGAHNTTPRGGENKATIHDPLCDGTGDTNPLTYLYLKSAAAMVYGGHAEDPTWLIQHEDETGVPAGGEASVWIAPRLESRQYLISDPDDVGSYAYDPFWGPGPLPRPKALTTSRSLTYGDVRAGRWLYNNGTSNLQVTIPDFTPEEPPVMSVVHFQHRGASGYIELLFATGVNLMISPGKLARTRVQGSVMSAQLISLNGENVPVSFGANQVWSIYGDLADA